MLFTTSNIVTFNRVLNFSDVVHTSISMPEVVVSVLMATTSTMRGFSLIPMLGNQWTSSFNSPSVLLTTRNVNVLRRGRRARGVGCRLSSNSSLIEWIRKPLSALTSLVLYRFQVSSPLQLKIIIECRAHGAVVEHAGRLRLPILVWDSTKVSRTRTYGLVRQTYVCC
jgi:hypothetical protein